MEFEIVVQRSVLLKTVMSPMHLKMAGFYASECRKIENSFAECGFDYGYQIRNYEWLQGFSASCFMSCAAFMESAINELISKVVDESEGEHPLSKVITPDQVQLLKEEKEKKNLFDKCDRLAEILGQKRMDRGSAIFQNAAGVMAVRNSLMHYKPYLVEVERTNGFEGDEVDDRNHIVSLEKRLKGKFEDSAFFRNDSQPYFPRKCLGAGGAEWAVKAVQEFVLEYYKLIGADSGSLRRICNIED
ncbi:hypothetical protein [Bdellovibrio sp. NC01]|uniref:hypothetical protein n=1 Tax=Bdellovibrio sp. NC01 TaxID=2220073 RepID=UPI001157AD28|nr:hypothetical protein [Bdellovibrio sp. NC01]QDK37952.1 hypothetical protein DOE51_10315 [Bdellovibrio sp. NC01]